MRVYVDFESRSRISIWDSGAYRYAEDPSTQILCLAWAIDNASVEGVLCNKLKEIGPIFNALIQQGAEFHAHNALFERSIWKYKMVPLGFLHIPITQWRDTAAKVSAHALPRQLEKAALALGCKAQKDMEGSKLMRTLCTTTGALPREKLERLLLYCKRDVEAEREIDQKLPDLCPGEQRVWFMDQHINDTGVCIDTVAVKNAIQLAAEETKTLNDELFKLTGGLINAGTQTTAIKNYLERKGIKIPNMQKQTIKDAISASAEGGDNLRILQLRQQLSLTSIAKYTALDKAVCKDGRVRDTLIYHGASTGRWSGKLVQVQNLVKATIPANEIETAISVLRDSPSGFSVIYDTLSTLSSCIRGMFIPSPGKQMFITDFSAIEARVVMWLAGETKGLNLFAAGDLDPKLPDIYVHMARDIYKRLELTKADKKERTVGKQTTLGCGFGMSYARFQETCEDWNVDLGPKVVPIQTKKGGKVLVAQLAITSVDAYRATFPNVVRFWYAIDDAFRKCVVSGNQTTCGKVSFRIEGDFLYVRLPSGRSIAYHHPKITVEGKITCLAVNQKTNHYEVEELWGSKIVENIVQATARDIMVEAMFRMFKAGHTVLFTVHDELVTEKESDTEANVVNVVRQVPLWANGCPINAECIKAERYQK